MKFCLALILGFAYQIPASNRFDRIIGVARIGTSNTAREYQDRVLFGESF